MSHELLVFQLDEQRYALDLTVVVRVLPMMEVAPLPDAPSVVAGIIDVAGVVAPVMDLRRRFGLPAREPQLSDVLILAHTRTRTVALAADGIVRLLEIEHAEVTPAAWITSGMRQVEGVVKLDDGLVLIHDVDKFLSAGEQERLERALDGAEVDS